MMGIEGWRRAGKEPTLQDMLSADFRKSALKPNKLKEESNTEKKGCNREQM